MNPFSSKIIVISSYIFFVIIFEILEDFDELDGFEFYIDLFFLFLTTMLLYFLISYFETRARKKELIYLKKYQNLKNKNQLLLKRADIIFENLHEGVVITDIKGNITEVNQAFKVITGYSEVEVIGNKMSILQSGKHDKEFYKQMWEALENYGKWSGQLYNKKKSGEEYTSFLTISTIRNNEEKVQHYIGIFMDISEVISYEKELQQKELLLIQQSKMAAMGEMIDNIAHQWKQPLGLVSMSNELIKMYHLRLEDEQKNEVILESVGNIDNEVKHLIHTIDDFRNFFNPNKVKKEFLINETVEKLLLLLQSRLKNKAINVVLNIDSTKLCSFENELVQVMMNIVNNAIDALGEKKEFSKYIIIESIETETMLELSIKDNAGGIPEEFIAKVFDSRFTTKEEGKDSGIGLYMSQQLVKSLEGTLMVENSQYEFLDKHYKGANFIIKVPKNL